MVNGYWEILFCMGIYYLVAVTSSHIPNFSFDCATWIFTNYISLWFLGFSLLSLSLIMLQGNTATFIPCVCSHFGFQLNQIRVLDFYWENSSYTIFFFIGKVRIWDFANKKSNLFRLDQQVWLILYVDIVIGRNLLETSKITVFYATACAKLKFVT